MREKWPREYAAEIVALPTPAKRHKALEKVPNEFRIWVQHYVERFFILKRRKRK